MNGLLFQRCCTSNKGADACGGLVAPKSLENSDPLKIDLGRLRAERALTATASDGVFRYVIHDRGVVDAPVNETNGPVKIVVASCGVVDVDGNSNVLHFGAVLVVVWVGFAILCYMIYFGDDVDNFADDVAQLLHISHSQYLICFYLLSTPTSIWLRLKLSRSLLLVALHLKYFCNSSAELSHHFVASKVDFPLKYYSDHSLLLLVLFASALNFAKASKTLLPWKSNRFVCRDQSPSQVYTNQTFPWSHTDSLNQRQSIDVPPCDYQHLALTTLFLILGILFAAKVFKHSIPSSVRSLFLTFICKLLSGSKKEVSHKQPPPRVSSPLCVIADAASDTFFVFLAEFNTLSKQMVAITFFVSKLIEKAALHA
uniref:Uncharacterized protein n=1 Tax=Glossina pallidipes TaxID=7398 RepID=A0A1A9ZBF7_GLOPL